MEEFPETVLPRSPVHPPQVRPTTMPTRESVTLGQVYAELVKLRKAVEAMTAKPPETVAGGMFRAMALEEWEAAASAAHGGTISTQPLLTAARLIAAGDQLAAALRRVDE